MKIESTLSLGIGQLDRDKDAPDVLYICNDSGRHALTIDIDSTGKITGIIIYDFKDSTEPEVEKWMYISAICPNSIKWFEKRTKGNSEEFIEKDSNGKIVNREVLHLFKDESAGQP